MKKTEKRLFFVICFLLYTFCSIYAQSAGRSFPSDPSPIIGLSVKNLIDQYGVPEHVYPVRGEDQWQDDVVFVYNGSIMNPGAPKAVPVSLDMYIAQDRVWQIGLPSAYGLRVGDPLAAATLALGEGLRLFKNQDGSGYALFNLPSKGWPLQLRLNLDKAQKISALFIYRSDF